MPPRVHFTLHPCEVLDAEAHHHESRHVPRWVPWSRHCPSATRYTTSPAEVTCVHCRARHAALLADRGALDTRLVIARIARGDAGRGELELGLRDQVALAWLGCCRHRGVASPFARPIAERLVREHEGARRREVIAALARTVDDFVISVAAAERRVLLERHVAELVHDRNAQMLRAELQPAIDDALVALDVLEEAERLLAIAADRFATVRERYGVTTVGSLVFDLPPATRAVVH